MLDTHYDHFKVEEGKYENWKNKGYFTAGDKNKQPFSIVIPPPNVTGKLHLGHAMDTILDDIIIRYKKMKGFDALWLPGTDHAGIATQAKVEAKLREQGINKYDIGRDAFLEKVWEWKNIYAETIHQQWAKLGLTLDYTRERFTLDPKANEAVQKVFIDLYNEGLIYQGERIINWDPELKTALSNIEIVYSIDEGEFFYFIYDIVDSEKKLIVATTRPETMFGDTAVFVNPNDERYKDVIGKKCINPANGDLLPIMADEYVDTSFGTGAMKCTPAHDPNDFALAKKYGFAFIKVLDESAHMNEIAGSYKGMDRYECRKALVEQIKKDGHLDHIEKFKHSVGHSERSGVVAEPMLSKQWFVKMKPLAAKLLEVQENKGAVQFIPKRFSKVLKRWMENVDDWCISRQLWWGHRIPAYYNKTTGEIVVAESNPNPEVYIQDNDVLDTWFSSGLWPFMTMGWPDTENEDYKRYFPTSILVTGYDIIFFWAARMIFQSLHFTKQIPFKQILIHGLIRDEQGRKMSKSLGNGIDPIDVINEYGVDALRYFITTNSTPGLDMRYSTEKMASSAAYLNKIWNATRFVEMTLGENYEPKELNKNELGILDRYILSRLNTVVKQVTSRMEEYQFGPASTILYNFVYDDFCGYYLEMSKVSLSDASKAEAVKYTLFTVIRSIILLIYPYCPFICEEMYLSLPKHLESVMLESYPEYSSKKHDKEAETAGELLKTMISDVRSYKSEKKIAPNAKMRLSLSPSMPFEGIEAYLSRFLFASKVTVSESPSKGDVFIYGGITLTIEEDVDVETLKTNLLNEKNKLLSEIERSNKMLSNPGFTSKAPKEKIELEENKVKENTKKLNDIEERLQSL